MALPKALPRAMPGRSIVAATLRAEAKAAGGPLRRTDYPTTYTFEYLYT